MKSLLIALLFSISSSFANPIDISCKQLTYKSAPKIEADQFVCHQEYAIAYSWTSRNPIYTTEFLDASHTGDLPRTNDFAVDPAIDKFHVATPNDYKNTKDGCGPIVGKRTSTCDQGHMTPHQDFSSCQPCVSQSFFMSNIVPQYYKNNEGIWKGMEMKIRGYAANHPKGVYVITGPVYLTKTPRTIGKNKVWVPDYLFKISINAETGNSIAFYIPNNEQHDLSKFVVNLETIEKASGIIFDSSLDKKKIANYQEWLSQTK